MSEAIVLRTYPFREADLIVSFFTRDQGKMRGVARRARRPGSRFGSGLERLSYVKMFYQQREQRELTTLESCEMIRSPFQMTSDYELTVVLDFIAEVSEQLLPPSEPFERFFRLIVAMLEHLRDTGTAGVWSAATYFSLWAVRLSGFLPADLASADDRAVAAEMLRAPIGELAPREWTKATASRLRRSLIGLIEEHIERRLVTAPMLEAL